MMMRNWKHCMSGIAFLTAMLIQFGMGVDAAHAIEKGQLAPDFTLSTYDGKPFRLSDQKGKIVVLEWFNPGCPFVKHQYDTMNMPRLQEELTKKGVVWVTINSTNANHQDFLTPEKAREIATNFHLKSGYFLKDETGTVGKQYEAKTTPHMYVINANGVLVYQGAIDDDADVDSDVTKAKNYVRVAVDELLSGDPVKTARTTAYGCSIKYAS